MSITIDEADVLEQLSTEDLLYELESRPDTSRALRAVNLSCGKDVARYAISLLSDAGLPKVLLAQLDEWASEPIVTMESLDRWLAGKGIFCGEPIIVTSLEKREQGLKQ